MKKRFLKPL